MRKPLVALFLIWVFLLLPMPLKSNQAMANGIIALEIVGPPYVVLTPGQTASGGTINIIWETGETSLVSGIAEWNIRLSTTNPAVAIAYPNPGWPQGFVIEAVGPGVAEITASYDYGWWSDDLSTYHTRTVYSRNSVIVQVKPAKEGALTETSATRTTRVVQFTIGSKIYTVNGQPFFMDVAPYIHNGRTYLPVRYVASALGANISYENPVMMSYGGKRVRVHMVTLWWGGMLAGLGTRTVYINLDSKTLTSNVKVSNGVVTTGEFTTITMDAAPVVKNGRTMLPLRWIAQALGASVDWDPKYQKVAVLLST